MNYLLAFDTETGGLEPKEFDLLTAYFAVLDEDLKIVDELDLKLKPENGRLPICHPAALNTNKIDVKKHLEDPETVTYSEGKKKLITMVKKYATKKGRFGNMRPMGYNILSFDIPYVQEYIFPKKEWNDILHYKSVDVMVFVDFLKDCGWFPSDLGSLGSVVDYFQLPKRNAHNAREDVLMTIDVYKRVLETMKAKKDGGQAQDLISLLEAE